jgi:hypothetical protein
LTVLHTYAGHQRAEMQEMVTVLPQHKLLIIRTQNEHKIVKINMVFSALNSSPSS